MIRIPETDIELLNECVIETFRSGGKGGQHVNKTETGVRLRHTPSGVVVSSRKERSQYRNKMICLNRLRKKLERMNIEKPPRIPTTIPKAAKNKAREVKEKHSQKKRSRSKDVDMDEE